MSLKEIGKMPSGRVLKIQIAPFGIGKAMYQSVCEELKELRLDPNAEVDVNLKKDLFLSLVTSKKVEACVWECMKFATLDDARITEDSFEKVEFRDDYLTVCHKVAEENIVPFWKSLYAQFGEILAPLMKRQA